MPTLAETVGSHRELPEGIDGVSIMPTLLGRKQEPRPFLYREFRGTQTVRMGRWKAVRNYPSQKEPVTELYDLANDIEEKHNQASVNREMVRSLERVMKEQHVPSAQFPLTNDEKLKARKKGGK